ncbi:MAG: tail fiber domain-containing protein, partial [Carnobacterium sp.]|uniref:tail fiber domain-containing protein n=1 Tax=Carnobacterium sp. TaxID=48221 RepID=UPI003C780824
GSQNTGISANTGLQLIGGHSYIDFISNISGTGVQQRLEASSGNMYIIHSNTGALRVRQAGQAENTGSVIAGFFKTSHDQGAVLTMWGDTINVPNDGNRNIHLVPNGTGSVIVGTWQGTRWNIQASDFVKVSSRATKTNIIPLDNGLNTINSLLPVTYNKIDKLNRGINEVEKGFIAEDSPSVSTPDGKGIYDSFIVAHLVKGMQELDIRTANETDILKARVTNLEQKIKLLESAA